MNELEKYIGVKLINAKPMSLLDAEAHLKRQVGYKGSTDKQGNAFGYLVTYEDGYQSWSPKDVFDNAYRKAHGMSFGLAVEALKLGYRVCRAGWNGKGMFLFLVPGSTFKVNRPPLLWIYPEGTEIDYCSHIDMKTADGRIVPWTASQTDVLTDDWEVVA